MNFLEQIHAELDRHGYPQLDTEPEPTSLYAVVVGKRDGETLIAVRADDDDTPWLLILKPGYFTWRNWDDLGDELTDIRVVDAPELAAKPEPGPWLRGDELEAVMSTLKADDEVEVADQGHTATGKLWPRGHGRLSLWGFAVRGANGKPGPYVDALRIIERAPEPEPGADIPDEVVAAACQASGVSNPDSVDFAHMRAALAAADAKRTELEEQHELLLPV